MTRRHSSCLSLPRQLACVWSVIGVVERLYIMLYHFCDYEKSPSSDFGRRLLYSRSIIVTEDIIYNHRTVHWQCLTIEIGAIGQLEIELEQ